MCCARFGGRSEHKPTRFSGEYLTQSAPDTRDFYKLKSLHYEKLKGDRAGQHSLRLNKQSRLIIVIARDDDGQEVVIIKIVDYH